MYMSYFQTKHYTVSSVVAPASPSAAIVGAGDVHGGGGIAAVVTVAAPSLSSFAVSWPVTLVDLPQLFIDLHPLQAQLLHLLRSTRGNGNIYDAM